jgi:hypothetical protein
MNQELACTDGAGTTTKMLLTNNGGHILATYGEFVEIFSNDKAETLPPHRSTDHAIDLEPGYHLPYGRIYNLSECESWMFKAYIDANQSNRFIQQTSLPAAAPVLFAKKKDGGLRLWVDYRTLNLATVKNCHPLPVISEMLDHVGNSRIFTKLAFHREYNLIQIKKGDECKTTFRTRYGQSGYRVMPFSLT